MRRLAWVWMAVCTALVACGEDEASQDAGGSSEPTPWVWELPYGMPVPKVPDDNPMTVEKVELGRFLFYDQRLSGNQTFSCGSCHRQALNFTDGLARANGSTGERHPRSSMALSNIGYGTVFGWGNPLLTTLEAQALIPMFGETPVELGLAGLEDAMLDRLRADARYQQMFPAAFPDDADPFTLQNVTRAIASFERTLISGSSPFDRYIYGGEEEALSISALRGMRIFQSEEGDCFHCHGGFAFTDAVTHEGVVFEEFGFHNNGLYNIGNQGLYPPDNNGVYDVSNREEDRGRFKAPTLRNIAVTAPYMHDGSLPTLEAVMDHYAAGGRKIEVGRYAGDGTMHPNKSLFVHGFRATDRDKADLIAFLNSLTDEVFLNDPRLSDPFAQTSDGQEQP